jgi:hypothetical protein
MSNLLAKIKSNFSLDFKKYNIPLNYALCQKSVTQEFSTAVWAKRMKNDSVCCKWTTSQCLESCFCRDSGVFACVSELRGQGNVGFDIFCNCSMLTYARYSSGMQWSINSDENLVSKRSRQHVKLQALWVYFQFLVIMSRIKIALPTFCPPRRNPKQRYVTRFSITSGSEVETMTHPLGSFWQWRIAKSDT